MSGFTDSATFIWVWGRKNLKSELKELTDGELVERIIKNDQRAFKQLYYNYYHALFRFAFFRVGSKDIAADLVQDLFFTIWDKRSNLLPGKSIKAYLYKALGNRIINYGKLISTNLPSIENYENINLGSEKNIEANIDIINAIENLPENLRIVFTLSRFDGFKYSEISEICEISVKAVEKRMNQAFKRLRNFLDK